MKHNKLSFGNMHRTTDQERAEALRIHNECNRLGIVLNVFSDNNEFSLDELEALKLINSGKNIPADLEKRLLEKKIKNNKGEYSGIDIQLSDEEVREFLK